MDTLKLPSYLGEWWFAILLFFLFAAGRYLILAGVAFMVCYKPGINSLQKYKIQERVPKNRQLVRELLYSLFTICIFSTVGVLVFYLFINGHTKIYLKIEEHGWVYFIFSILIMIIIHDAYFYWTHRLLHTKWFLRNVHIVHHKSVNPTPLAAYCFHPIEAIMESLIVFLLIWALPIHAFAFVLFTFIVLVMNIFGHLGYEFVPKSFRHGKGRFLTSSTHHNEHHRKVSKNYGYYFTFWDKLMKTLGDY